MLTFIEEHKLKVASIKVWTHSDKNTHIPPRQPINIKQGGVVSVMWFEGLQGRSFSFPPSVHKCLNLTIRETFFEVIFSAVLF